MIIATLLGALFVSGVLNVGLAGLYADYRRRNAIIRAVLQQDKKHDLVLDALDGDLPN